MMQSDRLHFFNGKLQNLSPYLIQLNETFYTDDTEIGKK